MKRPIQTRRNYVRRIYKENPLFALEIIRTRYGPDYSFTQLMIDLKRKKAAVKKSGKSHLIRFGRYKEIERLTTDYHLTGNQDSARRAIKLRSIITQPYRMVIKIGKYGKEYTFPAETPYNQIKKIATESKHCRSFEEFDTLQKKILQTNGYGK